MAFKFCSLAPEFQLEVLKELDHDSLASASRVNRSISADVMPLLWEDIDFQSTGDWYGDILDRMRDFFLVCDELQRNRPSRWRQLATYVHTLKLVRTPGTGIPFEDNNGSGFNWVMMKEERSIFDIIADFSRLRCLPVYCKISIDDISSDTVLRMHDALPELRELAVGGNIDRGVVLGLLSYPENMETLAVINLQDCQAGQERHSGGLLFLEPLAPRFTSLTYLHLCKLAELVSSEREVTNLRWDFDYENDRAVLSDWAMLLPHVSSTLEELTLEDRYLGSVYNPKVREPISPGDGEGNDPREWGEGSRKRFGEIILPVLNSQEWPKLQRLILTGVVLDGTKESDEKVKRYLRNLHSRLDVEIWPGRFVEFSDEVTPIEISPPESPFGVHG